MIKIYSEIPSVLVDPLEAHFCTEETSSWILYQKLDPDPHRLEGYFPSESEATHAWGVLRDEFPELPGDYLIEEIVDADWKNEYKKYLKPWNDRRLHWVPSWQRESYELPEGHSGLYLDAGMAFGTGTHETTQLCASRLLDYCEAHEQDLDSKSVVDAGCGSGILALSAAKLGFKQVEAFDIDPDAIAVSEENAVANGVSEVRFSVGGLDECLKPADFVMANILANILCDYASVLVKSVRSFGTLVLSGILNEEKARVVEHFVPVIGEHWGEYEAEEYSQGEWTALVFRRK